MTNREVAATLRRLADLLEIRGEQVYKVSAYRRAAESISQLAEGLGEVRARGELERIPGVGKAIAQKISDLLDTGSFKLLDEVYAQYPPGVADLLSVPDVGPKRARLLYEKLGIDSIDALRAAAASGSLDSLAGLGYRGAQGIREGLASLREPELRMPLGTARELGLGLLAALRDRAPELEHAELAGSVRRFRETVGNLDLVAASDSPREVIARFAELPGVPDTSAADADSCSILLGNGYSARLTVLPKPHWGSLLQQHTGSLAHNERLQQLAADRGASLDARGLHLDGRLTVCSTEEELYALLGLPFIPPEMREGSDEVELALRGDLPPAFTVEQLRGDLHVHSEWSDGHNSIQEMALAARERGYEYVCITDHSQSLGVANGLSPERIARQREEIDRVNEELAPFRVLQGTELEVRGDGSLDLPDEVLASLDLVVAAVHSGLRQGRERVTSRALAAIRHPLVDVLAHPTGRLVGGRPGGDFDMEALYAESARTGTVLEIDADPARLDLRDTHAHAAGAAGCMLSIDSDAHAPEGLENVRYGVAVAMRARLRAAQVLNTLPLDAMLASLKRNRR